MKHRLERVQEVIKRELGLIVARDFQFEADMVTIHSTKITPDLRSCLVFVGAIGTDQQRQGVLEKLRKIRPLLQEMLAKRVVLKYTPHLKFELDDSVERGTRVLGILNELDQPDEEDSETDT